MTGVSKDVSYQLNLDELFCDEQLGICKEPTQNEWEQKTTCHPPADSANASVIEESRTDLPENPDFQLEPEFKLQQKKPYLEVNTKLNVDSIVGIQPEAFEVVKKVFLPEESESKALTNQAKVFSGNAEALLASSTPAAVTVEPVAVVLLSARITVDISGLTFSGADAVYPSTFINELGEVKMRDDGDQEAEIILIGGMVVAIQSASDNDSIRIVAGGEKSQIVEAIPDSSNKESVTVIPGAVLVRGGMVAVDSQPAPDVEEEKRVSESRGQVKKSDGEPEQIAEATSIKDRGKDQEQETGSMPITSGILVATPDNGELSAVELVVAISNKGSPAFGANREPAGYNVVADAGDSATTRFAKVLPGSNPQQSRQGSGQHPGEERYPQDFSLQEESV